MISLVMIVKNEAEVLRRNLPLLKDAVDEWVIVDTGSTDETRDVISEYCGVVRELPWEDFVTTKNKALGMATGDWILFCDADEVLETDPAIFRAFSEQSEFGALSCVIVEREANTMRPVMTYHRLRMWRNDGSYKFVGPGVHEVCIGPGPIAFDNSTVFFHDRRHRSQDSFAERSRQYIALLEGYLNEHPGDPRALFYMGRTLNDSNRKPEAISWYLEYLESPSDFRDERWQANFDIANCYIANGDLDQARAAIERAVKIDPRRAEADVLMGLIEFGLQDYALATLHFEDAARKPIPDDVILFLDQASYGPTPLRYLVRCYSLTGHYHKALEAAEALTSLYGTPDLEAIRQTYYTRRLANTRAVFALGPTPEPIWGSMIAEKGVGGVETTYLELPKRLAKLGWDVWVFASCQDHVSDGVRFVNYNNIGQHRYLLPDVVIASRWFESFSVFPDAKHVVWLQDAHFSDQGRQENVTGADLVIVSSDWHRNYTIGRYGQLIDAEKVRVIPLGVTKSMFPTSYYKNYRQVVYSSNPDRGLFHLLDMWPEIEAEVSDIRLVITYGWEGLKTWDASSGWQRQVGESERLVRKFAGDRGNIEITGRLKKAELYRVLAESQLCLYPNNFWETFCLTAAECQMVGTPLITTDQGALATTVDRESSILIPGYPTTPMYRRDFVRATVDLMNGYDNLYDNLAVRQRDAMQFAAEWIEDWNDVALNWRGVIWGLLGG